MPPADPSAAVIPADALTLAQAAAICGLAPATLRRQVGHGRLRAVKIGHDYLTTRAWLDDYLSTRPDDRRRRGNRDVSPMTISRVDSREHGADNGDRD